MRSDVAPLAVAVLSIAPGIAILRLLGFVERSARSILAAAGLVYLTGFAAVGLVAIQLLVAGVPVTFGVVVAIAAAITVAAWLAARRRRPARPEEPEPSATPATRPRSRLDTIALGAFGVVFGAYAIGGLIAASRTAVEHWDGWAIWARKAVVLSSWDQLPVGVFAHPSAGMPHPDYPLMLPLFESLHFRVAGAIDTQSIDLRLWILLIAFGGAIAFVGARLTRPAIWVPVVLCALLAPGVYRQLLTGYADVPMGVFLALAAVLVGSWLARGRGVDLALGTLMLAAAANTKNEGLTAALCVLGAATVVTLARRALPQLRTLAPALLGFAAVILPWRLWIGAHHIHGDLPVGKGLSRSFLHSRSWRVDPAVSSLAAHLGDQHTLLFLVPLAVVLCAAGLFRAQLRAVACFYLMSGIGSFLLLVWAYWISPLRLTVHLATSANRVVIGLLMLSVAAILQLAGALERGA